MPTDISPNDLLDDIVGKFQAAQGVIRVPWRQQPYDIGAQTIKLTKTPLKIIGLDQSGHEIKTAEPGAMPVIRGTSPGLLAGPNPANCGIFHIGPGCSVEMSGLRLLHEIPPYAGLGHGSATIANLVDNTQESSLEITACAITTNATTAINVRSNTAPAAVPANKPVNRIKIRQCQVTGTPNQGIAAGNFSSINLGFWGTKPLDMRKAEFEISDCPGLNSLVFGVAVWKVLGDSQSKFLVKKNAVGNVASGVSFIFKPNQADEPVVLPKGEITITDNTIEIGKYLNMPENSAEPVFGAAGVLVRVSSLEDGQKVKTTIRDNRIDMTGLPPAQVPYKYNEGIVWELIPRVAQPELLKDITCHIHNNVVLPQVQEPVLVH